MSGFEFNRILTSIFFVALILVGTRILSDAIYEVDAPEKPAFMIEGMTLDKPALLQPAKKEIEDIVALMPTANPAEGKNIAKKCLQCHGFEKGGAHKIGPNLWNIFQAKIGQIAGYSYSKVFQGLKGSWTVEELNKFLYKPREYARGTKMSFIGLKKAEDRANLVAYLNQQSEKPRKF